MELKTAASEATLFLSLTDGKKEVKPMSQYAQGGLVPFLRQRCVVFKLTKENMLL